MDGVERFFLRLLVNAVALFVAAQVVPDIHLAGWQSILLTSFLFGLVNAFIRPLVMAVSCLLNIVTLGLFTLVVNAAMLWLTAWAAARVSIDFSVGSLAGAFFGALTITLTSLVLTRLVR